MKRLKYSHAEFELDALSDRQSVQVVSQHIRYVVKLSSLMDDSSACIQDRLKKSDAASW